MAQNSILQCRNTEGEIAKVLNSTEDAHRKSMSLFETDEHLQALMFVRSEPSVPEQIMDHSGAGKKRVTVRHLHSCSIAALERERLRRC